MKLKNYLKPEEYAQLDEYSKIFSNPIGKIVHAKRFETIHNLVKKHYSKGKKILDLCCGLCEWNMDNLDVVGLDVNHKALEMAKKYGRISKIIVSDGLKNNLPRNSFDILVNSQVLEHMKSPGDLIIEIRRLLKNKGILILAVPYDTVLSLWRPLFFVRCLWDGRIKGNKYFLKNGGHVNKFSPKSLAKLLKKHGFEILEIINDYRFTITIVAKK